MPSDYTWDEFPTYNLYDWDLLRFLETTFGQYDFQIQVGLSKPPRKKTTHVACMGRKVQVARDTNSASQAHRDQMVLKL